MFLTLCFIVRQVLFECIQTIFINFYSNQCFFCPHVYFNFTGYQMKA